MLRQNPLNRYTAGFLDVNEQHLAAIGQEHSNYLFATESVFRTRQHVTAIELPGGTILYPFIALSLSHSGFAHT